MSSGNPPSSGKPLKLRINRDSEGYLSLVTDTGEVYRCPICGNDRFVYNYEREEKSSV
jgi:transcription initiation factor TFIIB